MRFSNVYHPRMDGHTEVVSKKLRDLVVVLGGRNTQWDLSLPMMHGYFEMGNVACRIVSDTSLFMCKIRVLAVSMAYPIRIHAISGHHSQQAPINGPHHSSDKYHMLF